ncbi:MAG: sigma factor-like helix-turn-helix DNA-binding protein [Burkholderiales bacterium]
MTSREIGRELGMSHGRVHELQRDGMTKLRAVLVDGASPSPIRRRVHTCSLCAGGHNATTCPIPVRAYVSRGPRAERVHILDGARQTICGRRVTRSRWSLPARISDVVIARLVARGAIKVCGNCHRMKDADTMRTRVRAKGER